MFFLSHCCESFPSLGVSLPYLLRMSSNTVLISAPAVRVLRFSSGPTRVCSCLQCPQLSELVCLLLQELSVSFYIFHRHTRYSKGLAARAAGNILLQKGMATSIGLYAPVFLPGELPFSQRILAGQSTVNRVGHDQSDPAGIDARLFLPVAALPQ